ncbi:MAG: hypothetical protein J7519_08615 [Roseofilum sp. SID1]|nr:hypothetical protein [Roseofilum sp. SID1]
MILELFNNLFFKEKGVNMRIWEPELIALPIPKNASDASIEIELTVYVINNTLESVRLHPNDALMPELITSKGQTLQPEVAIEESLKNLEKIQAIRRRALGGRFPLTRWLSNLVFRLRRPPKIINLDDSLIEPGEGKKTSPIVRLLWYNNKLQLKFIKQFSYLPVSFKLNDSWCFHDLQADTYQLRFTRKSSSDRTSADLKPETKTEAIAPALATQFLSLSLQEPVGPDNSAVEVDGIRFETLVPQPRVIVPRSQPKVRVRNPHLDPYTLVEIGIRISNNTSSCFRFNLFASLIPQLIGTDGQPIEAAYGCSLTIIPKESDFPIVKPGESLTFFPKIAQLFWVKGELFCLSIPAGDGGGWVFGSLSLGTYQINFIYKNQDRTVEILDKEGRNAKLLEDIWVGMVFTPSITFSLVRSETEKSL